MTKQVYFKKCNSYEMSKFINNERLMGYARRRIIHGFNVSDDCVDDILFDAITKVGRFFDRKKAASFSTCVINALPSVIIDMRRKRTKPTDVYSEELGYSVDNNIEKQAHFLSLLATVENEILNIKNEHHRYILYAVFFEGRAYDELPFPITNVKKVVSRFRDYLREKYGEDLHW